MMIGKLQFFPHSHALLASTTPFPTLPFRRLPCRCPSPTPFLFWPVVHSLFSPPHPRLPLLFFFSSRSPRLPARLFQPAYYHCHAKNIMIGYLLMAEALGFIITDNIWKMVRPAKR